MKKYLKRFIFLILILTFSFIGVSYFFAVFFISSHHTEVGSPPPDLDFENVSFRTSDSLNIKGWYSRSAIPEKVVILLHGYKANRIEMLPYAKIFYDAGYGTFLYDARGCGESEGEMVSLGYYERNDLIAAIDYLRSKGVNHIGIFGHSQGGVTALLCGDSLKDVKCIISEVAFDKLENAIDNRFRKYLFIPGKVGAVFMIPFAESMLGISITDIDPSKKISKIKIPILIIGGEIDTRTIPKNTMNLYESANAPKELWIAPGAEHQDILETNQELFKEKVIGFLKENL